MTKQHPEPAPAAGEKHDWSHVLIPRGWSLLDLLDVVAEKVDVPAAWAARAQGIPEYSLSLAWPADGVRKASDNHYAQAWTFECLRAAIAEKAGLPGAAEQFQKAKSVVLLAYFPREFGKGDRGVGLWAAEQGCPSSHDGQHLNAVTAIRLAAVVSQDPELLSLSEELLLLNVRALLCVATADLAVWQAGMRSPGKPVSAAATAWLREALGEAHDGSLQGSSGPGWADHFYLQTRGLRFLHSMRTKTYPTGDPLLARTALFTAEEARPCTLKYPMDVYRWGSSKFLSVLSPTARDRAKGACDWVMVDGKSVSFGLDWKDPIPAAPSLESAAAHVHFPGISGK